MKWFQLSVKKLVGMSTEKSDAKKLEDALDFKYGNYNYSEDARSADGVGFGQKFKEIIEQNIGLPTENKQILVAGSNNGYEIKYLDGFSVTALDLSGKALKKLKEDFPKTQIVHANIETLPFPDDKFDVYISLRAIHSSNIDLEKALNESVRVTNKNGVLIYSVSNGYLINGKLTKGMYLYDLKQIDEKEPYAISDKIRDFLERKNLKVNIVEVSSEIFVIAKYI